MVFDVGVSLTGGSLLSVAGQVFHHGGQRVPGGSPDPHRSQGTRAGGAAAHHAQGRALFLLFCSYLL